MSVYNPRKASKLMLLAGAFLFLLIGTPTFADKPLTTGPPTTISGTIFRTYGDPRDGAARLVYRLEDKAGKNWALKVPPDIEETMDRLAAIYGLNVHVTGSHRGKRDIDVVSMGFDSTTENFAAIQMAISGSKAFRTLLCRFNADAAEQENQAFFDGMMGTTSPGADHYWQELSYGDLDLVGSTQHDWLELPEPRSGYIDDTDPDNQGSDLGKLFTDCKAVHEANGVDFTGVFGINLMFNDSLDCCAWGGGAGGFAVTWMPPWSWGSTSHGVLAQEMGHSFGLPHEGCQGTDSPYDSNWDPMSSAGNSQIHINAAFKDDLAWISGSRKYIANGSVNQIIDLERLALPDFGGFHSDNYLMAEIPTNDGNGTYYTVEARKFAGYDGSPDSPPFEAVVIHFVDWSLGDKNAVVVHEDDGNTNCNDASGAWLPGELFVDEENGISIAVLSEGASDFTIAINPSTDLAMYKTATPDPVVAGELITYHLTANNLGPGIATNVVVTDTLPAGVNYLADTDSCVEAPTGTLTCTAPAPILLGGAWSFNILASVDQDIVNGLQGSITNVASVIADQDEGGSNNLAEHTSFVISEADLEVQKICKPDGPAIAGEDTGSCEIIVTNHGPSMANNVSLVDEIFSDGTYSIVGISDDDFGTTCNPTGELDVTCDLGEMDAGEVIKVTVEVDTTEEIDINDLATVTSDTPDPDTSNNSATGQINFILPTADLLVTKQCVPGFPALAESDAFCEIFVYNNGPSTAKSVVLDDQIASDGNYEVTSRTTTVGVCSAAGPNVDISCNLGDIVSGDTVTVVVHFTSLEAVDVDDIATATSVTDDPDPNNNIATGSVTFVGLSNLSIEKTDSPDAVAAGTLLTYTLTVTNAGPSVAQNVVVTDQVPAGVRMVSAVAATGSCVMGVPGNALQPTLCGLGDLGINASTTITIVVLVLPDSRGVLHNDATVSSDFLDNDNSDNQVTEDTTIEVVIDLVLTKSADQDPVTAGTELRYILQLTNNGPSTAMGVILFDQLPAETSWVKTKVLGGVGVCLLGGSNPELVACTLNNMDPGETFIVVITVLVDPSVPDGAVITNSAFATSDDGSSNLVELPTDVIAEADLWIDKTGGFITQNPGKNILYTLTVHNDSGCSGDDPQVCGDGGPSDAQNVVVFDQLPATNKKLVVTFVSEDCLYDYANHSVTCVTPTLAAGDTVFHQIEATPKGRLRAITNIVDVESDTFDPDTGNNHDELLMIVGGGGQKGTGE